MKDLFTKKWIIENSLEIVKRYEKGVLTLRALHYQLVGVGMTNDMQHYNRVVNALTDARWDGLVDFDTFSDLDRQMACYTQSNETILEDEISRGKRQIQAWMTNYRKNRWENQPIYPEVLIEKKALQGVFAPVCEEWGVAMGACKGYPSLTFLYEMTQRIKYRSEGKTPIILYFGDYDPSGEDIPRSIRENLFKLGVDVEIRRIALMEHQVIEWNLPSAPAKATDSRTAKWTGLGQVEMDAIEPNRLKSLIGGAINEVFDRKKWNELIEQEQTEKEQYTIELREFVNNL